MEKKSQTIYLAIDVEKKGAKFEHPVIQIGVAWGTSLSSMEKGSFCFDYKDKPFEQRCFDEFWSKQDAVYKRICAEAVEPAEQWRTFKAFLDTLELSGDKVEIISDNPAYDVEAIDYHLNEELGRQGLRYSSGMKYRCVHDSSERVKGLPAHYAEAIEKKAQSLAKHTHWAADDAEYILVHFFLTKTVIDTLREAEDKVKALLTV